LLNGVESNDISSTDNGQLVNGTENYFSRYAGLLLSNSLKIRKAIQYAIDKTYCMPIMILQTSHFQRNYTIYKPFIL
jgi:hypothetical protein